jgi:hypothetical protein|tara:strand:+ start:2993 stop:3991 length:999 start_codon:yes stop_codon:yes gene_type:complete
MVDKKVAFVTELPNRFKTTLEHKHMRTEYAWMYTLDAEHIPINSYQEVTGYDYVIIIWPKGDTFLNQVGCELGENNLNPVSNFLNNIDFVGTLKLHNKNVCYMQEGPTWFCNDYNLSDQFNYYNQIANSDIIFAHNEHDTKWYRGLFPGKRVEVMPTLMIDELVRDIKWKPQDKTIIGGNFAKWYGGFQSYMVAQEFDNEIYVPTMHNKREHEEQVPRLNHLPHCSWIEWMELISNFKYAIHLMPTIAAGTFSLNCSYFGIPCIGNQKVDTQRLCFPDLSVDVEDVEKARKLAKKLKTDKEFYKHCSETAKLNYKKHYHISKYKEKFNWTNN